MLPATRLRGLISLQATRTNTFNSTMTGRGLSGYLADATENPSARNHVMQSPGKDLRQRKEHRRCCLNFAAPRPLFCPRLFGPSDPRTLGPWDPWSFGASELRTFGPSDPKFLRVHLNTNHGLVSLDDIAVDDVVRTPTGAARVITRRSTCAAIMYDVTLSNGIVLRVPEWRLLRSQSEWLPPSRLAPGTPLYMSMRPGLFGNDDKLELTYQSFRANLNAPVLPTKWNVELAEFVGVFAGRGFFTRLSSGAFTTAAIGCESPELLELLSGIAERSFARRPTRETGQNTASTLFFHSIDFVYIMLQLLHGGDPDAPRRAPASIMRSSEPVVAAFLRGFFEARAQARYPRGISTITIDHHLALDVQQLLTMFGMVSTVRMNHRPEEGRSANYLLILHGNVARERFAQRIGFLSPQRRAELESYMQREDLRDQFSLLLPSWFDMGRHAPTIRRMRKVDSRITPSVMSMVSDIRRNATRRLSLARIRVIADAIAATDENQAALDEASARDLAFLREIVDGEYFEVEVTSITQHAPCESVAIEVQNDAFMFDGIVTRDDVARAPHRRPHIVVRETPVARSAIAAGTIVNTIRGLAPISTIRDGEQILTAVGPRSIETRIDHDEAPAITIGTNGPSITCSPASLIRSRGAWVEAGRLAVGDPVYSSLVDGMFGSRTDLHVHYTAGNPDRTQGVVLPTTLTSELAEWLGYLLGHGPGGRDEFGRIEALLMYADLDDEDVIRHLANITRRTFHKEPSLSRRKIIHFNIHSIDIGGMVDQLGMGGAHSKRSAPAPIWTAPRHIIAAMLRGYIERKGNIKGFSHRRLPEVSIGCRGLALAHQIRQLLQQFGISTSLRTNPKSGTRLSDSYSLLVTPFKSKQRLLERIGFIGERKRRQADAMLDIIADFDASVAGTGDLLTKGEGCDLVALKEELFRYRRTRPVEEREHLTALGERIMLMVSGRDEFVTWRRAALMVDEIPPDIIEATAPFLREAVERDYFERRITHIEHTTAPTVALVVDDAREFLADGIVVGG